MKRNQLDKLISYTGLIVAVVLLATAVMLWYGHNFIHSQVKSQLSEQQIRFPQKGDAALVSLPAQDRSKMEQYAGQLMTTGAQAEVYADNFINHHLSLIGGGKTYAELSSESMAHPNDQKLAMQVGTVFKGETLRGMLLNAYAFDTMATVAGYGAIGALVGGLVMLLLVTLGFRHASVATAKKSRR